MSLKATDEDVLATARKYGLQPGSLKCEVFRLLDTGLSTAEVRYLLRDRRRSDDAGTFAATVRSYHSLWLKRQGKGRG
ncbi:MAG: hypothetical protein Q8P31_12580 [Bacillota bacterium]|nr:hypothetical protein [Bacillota bacterium]